MARFFREDCRTLSDSLQLEMVVAQYDLRMRDLRTPEGVPVGDACSAGVIAALEREGDELSAAILRALGYVGTGERGTLSTAASARLAEKGAALPRRFADVGGARAAGAWRSSEGGRPGECVLFVDFEYARSPGHALALFVEGRGGGTIKHIGLMGSMIELDRGDPFHPSRMDCIDLAEASKQLRDVIDRSFGLPLLANADDFRVLIAAARACSMQEVTGSAARSPS